jgi:hypothetical protein
MVVSSLVDSGTCEDMRLASLVDGGTCGDTRLIDFLGLPPRALPFRRVFMGYKTYKKDVWQRHSG